MPHVEGYDNAYYSMTWLGPKGYPDGANAGRCYFTGLLGMYRFNGESDILFADGTSGDGFSMWAKMPGTSVMMASCVGPLRGRLKGRNGPVGHDAPFALIERFPRQTAHQSPLGTPLRSPSAPATDHF